MPLKRSAPPDHVQFFITRIVGSGNFPDVDIITLPSYKGYAPLGYDELVRITVGDGRKQSPSSPLVLSPPTSPSDTVLAALAISISDAIPKRTPGDGQLVNAYIEDVYTNYQVPVLNSPLTGWTLQKLAESAAENAAFLVHVQNDHTSSTLYFFHIAGTYIGICAAGGIALGLQHGLREIIIALCDRVKSKINPPQSPKKKPKRASKKKGQKPP